MTRRYVRMFSITVLIVVVAFVGTLFSGKSPVLGLDLQGGISVVLSPIGESTTESLDVAKTIIEQRVNSLGVGEPEISRQGKTIVVDLPGVKNRDKARRLVGQTAEVRFRPVLGSLPVSAAASPGPSTTSPKKSTTTTSASGSSTTVDSSTTVATNRTDTSVGGAGGGQSRATQETGSTTAAAETTTTAAETTTTAAETTTTAAPVAGPQPPPTLPALTTRDEDKADATVILTDRKKEVYYELGPTPANLKGDAVSSANAALDPATSEWVVNVELTSAGSAAFNQLAATSFGKPPPQNAVAIVLDSVVQSAPAFQTSSFAGGNVQISGDFSSSEAEDLARVLKFGSLPVALEQLTSESVSPSLGKDQLRAGVIAGVLGLGLVALYMLLYYRLLGMVVISGVVLAGAVLYTLVVWLGQWISLTLTLSGVTGIIVSVGITVDSYVVYFEKLKDEVRMGKTVRSSVDRAFVKSFRTIVAADLVSLLGAIVLYVFAIGSVRGFALFLGMSTALDLAVSYFFMHPLVAILARRPGLVRGRFGLARGLDVAEVVA